MELTWGRAPGGWVTVWEKAASCEIETDRCTGAGLLLLLLSDFIFDFIVSKELNAQSTL